MWQFKRLLFLFLIIIVFCHKVEAQSYSLQMHSVDNTPELLQKEVKKQDRFSNATDAYSFIQQIVPQLQEKGYLAASLDSLVVKDDTYHLYLFLGTQYRIATISLDSIPVALLTEAAISKKQWENRPLNAKQLSSLSERVLRWCENNGYPFARVWLAEVQMDANGAVSGNLQLDKGQLRKIDSFVVSGEVKISKQYLQRHLGIQEGEYYNEKKLKGVSLRLRELQFLDEAAPWQVEFQPAQTRLELYLRERKANQLNALVGLLPNNVETGKLLLTVDALFAFQNILNSGESISVSYQNLQYKSPRMKADLVWPYLLNTAFGIDAHFDLFKKDTTFYRTSLQAGVRYQFTATDYVRVFYQNHSNRLITVDTAFVRRNKKLPDNMDIAAHGGGAEFGISRTDYRLNPRRGWQGRVATSALVRTVRRSNAITSLRDATFDYNTLYDSLEQNKYQYRIEGELLYYLPLGRSMVFRPAYYGGWISGQRLFQNELYQAGGFKLLRGFDEQSVYASQYHIASLELRLLLNRNSYVYLFSDNGYVQSNFNLNNAEGFYNGFGLGATLETKTGLFSISYALGRSDNMSVQFRQSKVHFGYVAYF